MGTILVVRHGETHLNHDNKVRGWADVPLNSHGIQEALATSKALEAWDIAQIIASDLMRTRQTAEIIAKRNFAPVMFTQYLRSWNTGHEMVGMDLDEAVPIMRYYVARPTETPNGGESFAGFLKRVKVAWNGIVLKAASASPKAIVVVTSSRDIDAFRYFCTGNRKYLDKDNAVPPGQVAEFQTTPSGVKEVQTDLKETQDAR